MLLMQWSKVTNSSEVRERDKITEQLEVLGTRRVASEYLDITV